MIIKELKRLIPNKNSEFQSLSGRGLYHYHEWGNDPEKLIYWFLKRDKKGKNTKYILTEEFIELLKVGLKRKVMVITRDDFKSYCKQSNSSGPCGFCIMARLTEILKVGEYHGRGLGIKITDPTKLRQLLN